MGGMDKEDIVGGTRVHRRDAAFECEVMLHLGAMKRRMADNNDNSTLDKDNNNGDSSHFDSALQLAAKEGLYYLCGRAHFELGKCSLDDGKKERKKERKKKERKKERN